MTKSRWLAQFFAAWLMLAAGSGDAESAPGAKAAGGERILFFRSEITVRPDTSIHVRETIRVRAELREIKHGIFRDFPTRFRDSDGVWFTVPLTVTEVLRDGKPEHWLTKERENGVRAFIGDANLLLEPGEHTYTLAYRTTRRLEFSRDLDALFWNVTGYGWSFPIDAVEALVLLPHGVSGVILDSAAGARASEERAAKSAWRGERGALFRSTRPLQRGEGLRVSAKWPRGHVREPFEPRSGWQLFVGSNRSFFAGLSGLTLVLTYCVLAARHAARSPERGDPELRGDVPGGLSPAAIRVVSAGNCDERAFAATVVQMAIKGYLSIEKQGGGYSLHRGNSRSGVLASEEALAAYDLHLERIGTIGIVRSNRVQIVGAINDEKNFLRVSLERYFLIRNREFLLPCAALSMVVLGSTLALEPGLRSFVRGLISLLLYFWTIGGALIAVQLFSRWKDVFFEQAFRRDAMFHAASLTVLALSVFLVQAVGLGLAVWLGSYSYGVVLLGVALLTVGLHYRLKRQDAAGRGLSAQTKDLAIALAAAQVKGMSRFGSELTTALYERFLPYAIALDCEKKWSRLCADVLARTGVEGRPYRPDWCRCDSADAGLNPESFASIVGDEFCAAIASAAASPGSDGRRFGSHREL